jgi:DNA-binding HxlR family transcriptional regulator
LKITQIIQIASIQILLYLLKKGEVRHSELSEIVNSRGTLSLSLKDLVEEGLIQRRVLDTKPIQSHYSLTEKGALVAKEMHEIKILMC